MHTITVDQIVCFIFVAVFTGWGPTVACWILGSGINMDILMKKYGSQVLADVIWNAQPFYCKIICKLPERHVDWYPEVARKVTMCMKYLLVVSAIYFPIWVFVVKKYVFETQGGELTVVIVVLLKDILVDTIVVMYLAYVLDPLNDDKVVLDIRDAEGWLEHYCIKEKEGKPFTKQDLQDVRRQQRKLNEIYANNTFVEYDGNPY